MNLAKLQKEAHAIARDHGWWDTERTFGGLHRAGAFGAERGAGGIPGAWFGRSDLRS